MSMKSRVCVIVPAFPVMGGILTVLEGMEQAMQDVWQIEYLTQHVGADLSRPSLTQHVGADSLSGQPVPRMGNEVMISRPSRPPYIVHRFGTRRMTPWYFPFAWLYVLAGVVGAINRAPTGYDVLLPQDGIFSALLAGLAGKITGARVVVIDHGDISLFTPRNQRVYRAERRAAVETKGWPWFVRLAARSLLSLYWPSRWLAARLAARLVDHYLIPGVPEDSSAEGCALVGIPAERVTRYNSMIDSQQHSLPDAAGRAALREARDLPADALVVAIVCRLAPEKGLDIALASIEDALARLTAEQRARVHVVIAGDGPERASLEQDARQRGISQICSFWGELAAHEVRALLGISDIFLYTSTRGACMAMAVLEAMASGCAVIASTEPLANATLLAEGRGIVVPAGDIAQTSDALLLLLDDERLCRGMGMAAREYIRAYHNPDAFRGVLLHALGEARVNEPAAGGADGRGQARAGLVQVASHGGTKALPKGEDSTPLPRRE